MDFESAVLAKYVIPIGIPSLLYMDDYFNPTSAMGGRVGHRQRDPSKSPEYSAKTGEQGPRIEPKDGVDLQPEEWEQILEDTQRNTVPRMQGVREEHRET